MKNAFLWMNDRDVIGFSEYRLARDAFGRMSFVLFAAMSKAEVITALHAITGHPDIDRAELACKIRVGVVGKAITSLIESGEERLTGKLGELRTQIAGLDFEAVLALESTLESPLAILQAALRDGTLVDAQYDDSGPTGGGLNIAAGDRSVAVYTNTGVINTGEN